MVLIEHNVEVSSYIHTSNTMQNNASNMAFERFLYDVVSKHAQTHAYELEDS